MSLRRILFSGLAALLVGALPVLADVTFSAANAPRLSDLDSIASLLSVEH